LFFLLLSLFNLLYNAKNLATGGPTKDQDAENESNMHIISMLQYNKKLITVQGPVE